MYLGGPVTAGLHRASHGRRFTRIEKQNQVKSCPQPSESVAQGFNIRAVTEQHLTQAIRSDKPLTPQSLSLQVRVHEGISGQTPESWSGCSANFRMARISRSN